FDIADVKAIEGRRLGLEERRLGGSRTRLAYEAGGGSCRCAGEQMTARQSRIDHLIHSLTIMLRMRTGVCKAQPTPNAKKLPLGCNRQDRVSVWPDSNLRKGEIIVPLANTVGVDEKPHYSSSRTLSNASRPARLIAGFTVLGG